MAAANAGSFRLVRCPKCLNVLPEPPNVTVYKCGGCDTTLRAKIRVSNYAPTKQARQDSEDYSVATTVSNGVPPQTKNLAFGGAAIDSSCTAADAPSTETEHDSNGASTNDNDHVTPSEEDALDVVANNESNKDCNNSSGQNTNARMEGPSVLTHPSANGTDTDTDSDREETDDVDQGSPKDPDICREGEDNLTASDSEHDVPLSEGSKSDSELNAALKTEAAAAAAASKKSYLVRMQSRSCDLREAYGASLTPLDYTSLQSKSFRASEPLQSKIMKTVDELRGDLSEFFRKPAASSECKPKAAAPYHPPPRPSKQGGGYVAPRAAVTSSAPLAAYHAAAKRSGHAAAVARRSRSGQVAPPRGLPSPRYRRRRGCSYCHSGQMEMARQQCTHDECYHSCRPPPFNRQWNQEAAMLLQQKQRLPPAKETKRRAVPRNHCRPVLRGAPFVVCSRCLRLVELPTGFAVPSRGTRRLQCGSCSAVLSYSYRDPGKKRLQSPSGDEEYSTDDYDIHHVAAGAGAGDYRADCHDADPFSYSEEYGSYSTEDEHPLHVSRNTSFGTVDGRDGKDSKLHRLMGYSSASEILRHSPGLFESFEKRTPVGARTPQDMKGKGVVVADDDGCSGGQGGATKGSNTRSGGLLLQGFLKRGIHGLESLKLRS